ncbi:V-type ATP synthase subunit I [Treponema pectinovorum]|uniref:V-type ATP synthase subunit I n=1 Tax=Treponema pectinovorum TaxID=164 RepID=UPI0011C7E1C0|nr:V-type ATPase 116kDa subunit family protein [Treponema pectinovorum]
MAKTAKMRLVELMTLKEDIDSVIEFLGKKGNFQFQQQLELNKSAENPDARILEKLKTVRSFLGLPDITSSDLMNWNRPTDYDRILCQKFIYIVEQLQKKQLTCSDALKRSQDAYNEAKSFANLKVSYSELEHLSFLSMRIGKIDPAVFEDLADSVGGRAVIIALGDDKSHILAATSKRGRFALDTELKNHGFVNMEIPSDFKGVPDEVLTGLKKQTEECKIAFEKLEEERHNLAKTQADFLKKFLCQFSIGSQIKLLKNSLEATDLVYRLTGWIPEKDCHEMMTELDRISEGRIAIRLFEPKEVPSVRSGVEKVPVKLHHGKFISSFERMIFSYGSPAYGGVDPTPFVAMFFTLLFGIMFGDAGQGLVFFIAGILLSKKIVKVEGWNKFGPVFMAIGFSSMVMGFLTGEVFATEGILKPASLFVTSLFGEPHYPILEMKFWESKNPIVIIFGIFGFTMAIGFVINSVGLIINIVNKISQRKWGSALFGKTGLSGMFWFWYVVVFALRLAFTSYSATPFDWLFIGITLFLSAFGEPFERFFDGEEPFENGIGSAIIGGFVELIEVISTYLSNSISFVRVGAFALAHAVLGFIIETMCAICPAFAAKIIILILGNTIVIVLEGMIVAIQVIRLQYYEFFSKFFSETGKEFVPFVFEYK